MASSPQALGARYWRPTSKINTTCSYLATAKNKALNSLLAPAKIKFLF
jgi:hypothetical protein